MTWGRDLRQVLSQLSWAPLVLSVLSTVSIQGAIQYGLSPRKVTYSIHDPSLAHPYMPETVPIVFVYLCAFGSVFVFLVLEKLCSSRLIDQETPLSVQILENSIVSYLGLLESMFWTWTFTTWVKYGVGELRPDFFDRLRQGNEDHILDGHLSFPSGHTSLAFVVATSLSLHMLWIFFLRDTLLSDAYEAEWMAAEAEEQNSMPGGIPATTTFGGPLSIRRFGNREMGSSLQRHLRAEVLFTLQWILTILPLVGASWVGVTRMVDHRHFSGDVVAGALLGCGLSTCIFLRNTVWYLFRKPAVPVYTREGSFETPPTEL